MTTLSRSGIELHVSECEEPEAPVTLNCQLFDKLSGTMDSFTLYHTAHSQKRAAQRGISPKELGLAVAFGQSTRKQQMIFYTLGRKLLPNDLDPQLEDQLARLVVLTNGNGQEIITCYRNEKHSRNIRKKRSRRGVPKNITP